jgi:methyl-accepting chemotaxis protein
MRFSHLKVRTRIYTGFAALVVLSLCLAGFGVYQMLNIGSEARTMNTLSGVVWRVLGATYHLEAIRRAETRMRIDGADQTDATDNLAQVRAQLSEATQMAISDERRRGYLSVLDVLKAHDDALRRFSQLVKTVSDQRAALFAGGDALTAAASRLVEAARATHDPATSEAAADVNASVLLVRVANWRFMATTDKNGVATFRTNSENARTALTALQHIANPEVGALIPPVQTALAAYVSSFDAFSAAKVASEELYDQQMRPQIKTMQAQLDATTASLKQASDVANANAVSLIASSSLLAAMLAALGLVIGVGLAFVISRGIVRPLTGMTDMMTKLAAGDRTLDVPARDNTDEIGDMARAVEVFKQNAIEADRLAREQTAERAHKERRQAAMEQHTQDFGTSISGVMASLAAAASTMHRAANQMSEAANGVHSEASSTAGSATKSSQDLISVAAAVEQLTSSVDEISRQVAAAAEVARQAVQRAEASQETIRGLADSTSRIGDVVHLISDIAGQTNLLALNATIEAARAGEAGKGFAVVAGEVKALAAQTAKATADIGSQIETVRGATEQTITAMTEISGIIGKMNEVTAAISAAVEEQSATTREIAASVQAVSHATADTARAMEHVVTVADSAGEASRDVSTGAEGIGHEAETLRNEVDQFLAVVTDDSGERRHYERIAGNGATVGLRTRGRDPVRATLRDMSRGGAALACDWTLAAGTTIEVDLPEAGGSVTARVARCDNGYMAVVFSGEPAVLARIDRVMDALPRLRRAA